MENSDASVPDVGETSPIPSHCHHRPGPRSMHVCCFYQILILPPEESGLVRAGNLFQVVKCQFVKLLIETLSCSLLSILAPCKVCMLYNDSFWFDINKSQYNHSDTVCKC